MRLFLLTIIILLTTGTPAPASPTASNLAAENRLLETELVLAKKNQIYFLFDLSRREILFRAHGLTIARLPVNRWRLWGPEPADTLLVLREKQAFFEPERATIRVRAADAPPELTAPGELQALELSDMPAQYRLLLSADTGIRVVTAPGGFFQRGMDGVKTLFWYLSRPLISNWQMLRGNTYTELQIALQPDDARLLYWSLTAGAGCLVRWPQG